MHNIKVLTYSYNNSLVYSQINSFKVWVKPAAEMTFLYGNNVTKAGLARITDGIPQYGGVIVYR